MTRKSYAAVAYALAVLALGGLTTPVFAQTFAPTIQPNSNPIAVSTAREKIAARPKVDEQTLLNVAFGATASGGNTKAYGGTLGGRFTYIRDANQLTLEALGQMAGARQQGLTDVDWTARNVVARARYDRFLSTNDALFVALAPRRDKFAGLDLRLQAQAGYLRNLYNASDAHRLWSELGYDFTFDDFSKVETKTTDVVSDAVCMTNPELCAPDPLPPAGVSRSVEISRTITLTERNKSQKVHSARIFLGYTNRLTASANLTAGVETLLDFQDRKNVRVNSLIEFTSSITNSFKLGLQGRMLFDNVVPEGIKKLDTLVAVQLVYTFDSAAEAQVVATCPACDCSTEVNAAKAACRATEPLQNITR